MFRRVTAALWRRFALLVSFTMSAGAEPDTSRGAAARRPVGVYVGPRGQCQSSYVVDGTVDGNFFPGGAPYAFSPVGDCGLFLAFPPTRANSRRRCAARRSASKNTPGRRPTRSTRRSRKLCSAATARPRTRTSRAPCSRSKRAAKRTPSSPRRRHTSTAPRSSARLTPSRTSPNRRSTSARCTPAICSSTATTKALACSSADRRGSSADRARRRACSAGFRSSRRRRCRGRRSKSSPIADVWSRVTATVEDEAAFKDAVEPNEVDDAVAVEWDQFRTAGLPSGQEASFSIVNRTQVPTGLDVQPSQQTHTVGQTAAVTVTATDTAGAPYANRPIVYSIGGANPKTGSVTTNASGAATIGYVGTVAGLDTMRMFLDLAGSGSPTPQDPARARRSRGRRRRRRRTAATGSRASTRARTARSRSRSCRGRKARRSSK